MLLAKFCSLLKIYTNHLQFNSIMISFILLALSKFPLSPNHSTTKILFHLHVYSMTICMLWVQIPFMARCTLYNIMWLVTGQWFSPGTPVSSSNKTSCHDITEILLKVALSTINYQSTKPTSMHVFSFTAVRHMEAIYCSKYLVIWEG